MDQLFDPVEDDLALFEHEITEVKSSKYLPSSQHHHHIIKPVLRHIYLSWTDS